VPFGPFGKNAIFLHTTSIIPFRLLTVLALFKTSRDTSPVGKTHLLFSSRNVFFTLISWKKNKQLFVPISNFPHASSRGPNPFAAAFCLNHFAVLPLLSWSRGGAGWSRGARVTT